MTLEHFVKVEIPKRCEVHPVYGEIAWMIFHEERNGNPNFAQSNFKSVRERAKLALPFNPGNKREYNRCLDIIELILLTHGQKHHSADNADRIAILQDARYTEEESQMMAVEWWIA